MAKAKTIKKAEPKSADIPSKKKEKEKQQSADNRREYSSQETYYEGETIYHKIWDDMGEVLEVGITEDGIKKMKVQFEKVGIKTLCMGQVAS